MPSEYRKIMFTSQELLEAVHSYRRRVEGFLPPGKLANLMPTAEGMKATVESVYSGTSYMLDVAFNSEVLKNILIRYCHENNIPLLRVGTMVATGSTEGATLEIAMTTETVRLGDPGTGIQDPARAAGAVPAAARRAAVQTGAPGLPQ